MAYFIYVICVTLHFKSKINGAQVLKCHSDVTICPEADYSAVK